MDTTTNRRRLRALHALVAIALLAGACGGGSEATTSAPIPTPTPLPEATAAPAPATADESDSSATDGETAAPAPVGSVDIAGSWNSDYGLVQLTGEGAMFAGPYGDAGGRVSGELAGTVLTGFWFSDTAAVTCDEPKEGSDRWGAIVWTFDESATAFEGLWSYCDDMPDRAWSGSRAGGDPDVVQALTTPDDQREADPLLVIAAARGDLAEVELQLGDGGDPNIARESDGWTPLLFAAQDGYTDIVNVLVSAGADVDRGTDDNWTALMIASQNGHEDTVAALLAAGANPRVGRASNWTALHSAALRNRPGIVGQLLAAGAPTEAAERGFTPLTIAAQEGVDAIATLLIDGGARLDGAPAAGPTPLYMAVQNGYPTMAELLLAAGANPAEGGTNDPPMVTVGARDRNEIAAILVNAGADIDQARDDGFTALHWAAYRDNAELVQILLDLGADTGVVDNGGSTPLDIAVQRDSDAAAALLR